MITRDAVLETRIATQRLAGNGLARAVDVVSLLACVQSQEYAHAFWSLGIRTTGMTYAEVQAEFDAGAFLRTHILRPTWHFVAAADLRWIQAVTAARVQRLNGTVYRQEGLGPDVLDRALKLIMKELTGGVCLTRAELGRVLATEGLPLAYLIMNAELEGVICSGPMRGAQHTYALVSERVSHSADGDAGELAYRFFVGHGPASVKDFARWSSLTLTQCNQAVEAAAGRLESEIVDGSTLWFDPAGPGPANSDRAMLLPIYDELTLSYPKINFGRARQHPHQPGTDRFVGSVIVDKIDVGTWRRTVKGQKLIMELTLAPGVDADQRAAVEAEAARLAGFLGKELQFG